VTKRKSEDGYLWYCNSCGLEFSIDDDDVKIAHQTSTSCLVIVNGRAHSLSYTTWTAIQKRRDCENHSLTVSQSNLDRVGDRKETESVPIPETAAEKLKAFTTQGAPSAYFQSEVVPTGEQLLNEIFKEDDDGTDTSRQ
jgi:hypothetical protein